MIVELRKLTPNPFRDFTVDPIDSDKVAELAASIKEDGYWGGVVARRVNGVIQIAAGHHRVDAAKKAGLQTADIFVSNDIDDTGMVRIYARENATQRGNTSAAQAGSVAAAIRILAKIVLGGVSPQLGRHSLEILRGQIATEKGLGEDIVLQFLEDVPGITKKVVEQQLAGLKASGHYARIIGEVRDEIEAQHREALKALAKAEKDQAEIEQRRLEAEEARKEATARAKAAREDADRHRAEIAQKRAEIEAKLARERQEEVERELKKMAPLRATRDLANKAAGKSAEREITFDLEGVTEVLTNAHHVDTFRQLVTGPGIKPYLSVKQQAPLARKLVGLAKQRGTELTGRFLRDEVGNLVLGVKSTERRFSKEDRQAALEADLTLKAKHYQQDFVRACAQMIAAGVRLKELSSRWPKQLPFPFSQEFRVAVKEVKKQIDALASRM